MNNSRRATRKSFVFAVSNSKNKLKLEFCNESQFCCNESSNSLYCLLSRQCVMLISAINNLLLDNNTYFLNDVNKYSGQLDDLGIRRNFMSTPRFEFMGKQNVACAADNALGIEKFLFHPNNYHRSKSFTLAEKFSPYRRLPRRPIQ